MSYRPAWSVPRVLGLEEVRAELVRRSVAARLGVAVTDVVQGDHFIVGFEGLGRLWFSRADRPAECDFTRFTDLESTLIENSPEALEALLQADLGDSAPVFSAELSALRPDGDLLLFGTFGPWLLSRHQQGGACYVPLLDPREWEARCGPHDPNDLWDAGVRRIRIQGQSALACGGPSLVFAREGNCWREVPTGITERVHFCDALQHGPDLWLVTMAGDVWRSRDGKATKVLSGEPGSIGSDEYRFDVRPFGAGLAIANGTSKVHLWDGERLGSVSLPGVRDEALRWLASAGPNELWVASENRLFVGDGRQWFEPALPSDDLCIHGLCADPSGGVWVTGTKQGPMVLRATVAGGVQAMDCPASSEHGFVLSDPSAHRGGVLAVSLEEWMTFRPSQVGMALSLRLDLDFDDLETIDRSDTFFAVLNELVAGWGGWSEG